MAAMDSNPEDKHPHFQNETGIPLLHGPLTEEEKRSQEQIAAEAAHKQATVNLAKTNIKLTTANLYLTWVLAVATCVGSIASWYQGCASRKSADAAQAAAKTAQDTLTEMKTGSGATDTHNLAQQAVTQAQQTTKLASDADQQVTQDRIAANAAKSAANTAHDSLESYRDVQSAHLTIENFNPDNSPDNPKPGTFQIVNRGASIATQIYSISNISPQNEKGWGTGKVGFTPDKWEELAEMIRKDKQSCGSNSEKFSGYSLGTGIEGYHSEDAIPHPTNPNVYSTKVGEAHYIVVCYTDIFKRTNTISDCIYWRGNKERGGYLSCRLPSPPTENTEQRRNR